MFCLKTSPEFGVLTEIRQLIIKHGLRQQDKKSLLVQYKKYEWLQPFFVFSNMLSYTPISGEHNGAKMAAENSVAMRIEEMLLKNVESSQI